MRAQYIVYIYYTHTLSQWRVINQMGPYEVQDWKDPIQSDARVRMIWPIIRKPELIAICEDSLTNATCSYLTHLPMTWKKWSSFKKVLNKTSFGVSHDFTVCPDWLSFRIIPNIPIGSIYGICTYNRPMDPITRLFRLLISKWLLGLYPIPGVLEACCVRRPPLGLGGWYFQQHPSLIHRENGCTLGMGYP